jgi:cytochrome c-type biogenesis protein CcmH
MRRAALSALAALAALAALTAAGPAGASAGPRASLTDIENDVMCTICHTPLAVSQSPEADRERAFISNLIAKGYTKPQIENELVAQYGPSVLALPPAHGFNLTVYILPPAIVLLGVAGLIWALPRWRRRTRAAAAARSPAPTLDPVDAERLDQDLANHPS